MKQSLVLAETPTEAEFGDLPENSTTKELAAYLNMRVPALAQMRYRGTGPAYRKISARTVRYRKADVLAWLEGASRTQTKDHVA